MDGSDSEMTLLAEQFLGDMSNRFSIPCLPVDERLTSFEAEQILKDTEMERSNKADADSLAACLIIESWFNLSDLNSSVTQGIAD